MCLAVPLKITAIDGNTAKCESLGLSRDVRIDFLTEPRVGEYVIVHAGFAIEKLDEEQAQLDLQAWKDVQDALR